MQTHVRRMPWHTCAVLLALSVLSAPALEQCDDDPNDDHVDEDVDASAMVLLQVERSIKRAAVLEVESGADADASEVHDVFEESGVTAPTLHLLQGGIVVRYAIFDPPPSIAFHNLAFPALAASLCRVERYLAPAAASHPGFGELPSYLFYTDSRSDGPVREFLTFFPDINISGRISVLNLDQDPTDAERMRPYNKFNLDTVNTASLRRSLADMAHLPVNRPRLLLGLDVSFLQAPEELLNRAAALPHNSVLHMSDPGWLYTLTNYHGPQCPGMIGDFIYMSPGDRPMNLTKYEEIVNWYIAQPIVAERHQPACGYCVATSHGLHAIDQFATMLALGDWSRPQASGSGGGCYQLRTEHYLSSAGGGPRGTEEAVHDKVLRLQGAACPSGLAAWTRRVH